MYPGTILVAHTHSLLLIRRNGSHRGKLMGERSWSPQPAQCAAPVSVPDPAPESERAQHPSRTSTPGSSGVPPPATRADYLLDLDWEKSYSESSNWGPIWQATHWEDAEWPEGYQLIKNKLYWGLNLCIPEDYVMEIVRSYHFLNGHPGVEKLIKGLRNRYNFLRSHQTKIFGNCQPGSKGVVQYVRPVNTQIGLLKVDTK